MKRVIFNLVAFIISFVIYYVTLPAFNIHNFGMYGFLFVVLTLFSVANALCAENKELVFSKRVKVSHDKKKFLGFYLYGVLIACFVLIFIINFIYSPVFMSSKYASRIEINENTDFNTDIKEIDFNNLPLLDKESSS